MSAASQARGRRLRLEQMCFFQPGASPIPADVTHRANAAPCSRQRPSQYSHQALRAAAARRQVNGVVPMLRVNTRVKCD